MPDGDAREGKWRGNWRMEWVASTLTLPRNMVYPAILPLMCTPRLPVDDWTDAPADLNGLVRFAERPNLVSARVPSHFKRTLPRTIRFSPHFSSSLFNIILPFVRFISLKGLKYNRRINQSINQRPPFPPPKRYLLRLSISLKMCKFSVITSSKSVSITCFSCILNTAI
jgi:hypothetical protein